MSKSACVPYVGVLNYRQMRIDEGRTCRTWRRRVIDSLQANPPDLIIFTHSDNYKLYKHRGQPVPKRNYPRVWMRGLKQTLSALPPRSDVLVLGGLPRNRDNPLTCLKRNPGNISACVSPSEPRRARKIENALRDGAHAKAASFLSPYRKVCSYDLCPLAQGSIGVWRDKGHLTDTFARKPRPSIRRAIESTISGTAPKR